MQCPYVNNWLPSLRVNLSTARGSTRMKLWSMYCWRSWPTGPSTSKSRRWCWESCQSTPTTPKVGMHQFRRSFGLQIGTDIHVQYTEELFEMWIRWEPNFFWICTNCYNRWTDHQHQHSWQFRPIFYVHSSNSWVPAPVISKKGIRNNGSPQKGDANSRIHFQLRITLGHGNQSTVRIFHVALRWSGGFP